MTNKQIFKKAKQFTSDKKKILDIFVAIKLDGYKKIRKGKKNKVWGTVGFLVSEKLDKIYGEKDNGEYNTKSCEIPSYSECRFFKHDFAKVFWGEQGNPNSLVRDKEGGDWNSQQEWKYRLQEMVLEKKPLKYIEKFLN